MFGLNSKRKKATAQIRALIRRLDQQQEDLLEQYKQLDESLSGGVSMAGPRPPGEAPPPGSKQDQAYSSLLDSKHNLSSDAPSKANFEVGPSFTGQVSKVALRLTNSDALVNSSLDFEFQKQKYMNYEVRYDKSKAVGALMATFEKDNPGVAWNSV